MPIFEFVCASCGKVFEKLVLTSDEKTQCEQCGGTDLHRLLSATSSASGVKGEGRFPGAGDTSCCGSGPASRGCVPGSCCGKA